MSKMKPRYMIEPVAVLPSHNEDGFPSQHEIELSKAISLKRIADHICGDETHKGLAQHLGDQIFAAIINSK